MKNTLQLLKDNLLGIIVGLCVICFSYELLTKSIDFPITRIAGSILAVACIIYKKIENQKFKHGKVTQENTK
ncbi:MAG: hypothetical protein EOP46_06270 [Sphingobacteriaceae bacterium]|nr:MAG: hypothetical protein EOP46_06270 [Sphingobacteriaceae bacterium]